MEDRELEQKIRTAVDHAAPDRLEAILAACGPQVGNVVPFAAPPAKKKRRRYGGLAAVAAMLAVVCVLGLGAWRKGNTVASVVSLDVNPSIQLEVNDREKVISARPLNDDAQVILEGMDLRGTQLKVAVNAIVGSLLQNGYLERLSSAILISVEDGDAARASRLESDLSRTVNDALASASAGGAVLSQTVAQDPALEAQAQTSGISVGKASLVRRVAERNPALDFNALAALSVEELQQLWETGAPGLPVGTDAARDAALTHAGLTAAETAWDVDPELDERTPHYEVELQTAFGSYDYRVDAWTGAVLSGPANVTWPQNAVAPPTGGDAGKESAISAALTHAGVSRDQALGLRCKLDWDDGRRTYEVEFRAGGIEYEYEIDAATGTVLQAERDGDGSWYQPAPPPDNAGASAAPPVQTAGPQPQTGEQSAGNGPISQDAALNAALAHAGVSRDSLYDFQMELDEDDGRLRYEIEFKSGRMEYDYEVDAYSGAILNAEQDWDD